jgi:SAM-dependent methyltransferase
MLDALDIRPGQRILEIGCGTGADSLRIAQRMQDGELYLQDISCGMLTQCKQAFDQARGLGAASVEFAVAQTSRLPLGDAVFDRVFHFGGLNMFEDIPAALSEMARVTKPGGKIVVGDESVAPWLRDHEFGRVVMNNNPLYRAEVPLAALPVSARDVRLDFLVNGTFYLISFAVAEGAPPLDMDLPHEGRRGGTMRTRYYGQLEGVTVEAKEIAIRAAAASGKSLHQWLDDLVKREGGGK